jgi:SAM-dependent methyltransferase
VPNMHAITKAMACEAACHARPLGRHDCELHLRCLKELSPGEVLERLRPHLPVAALRDSRSTGRSPTEKLNLVVRIDGGVGDLVRAARFVEGLFLGLDHCNIEVFFNSLEAAQFVFHRARHVRAIRTTSAFKGLAGGTDIAIVVAHLIRYDIRDWAKIERLCPAGAAGLRSAIAEFQRHQGLFERRPSLDAFWARLSVSRGRSAAANLDLLAGFPLYPFPMLAPDPGEYVQLRDRERVLGGRYITVHDGFDDTMRIAPGRATKCWPIEHWAELVASLHASYPSVAVVQLGGPKSRQIPGVDLDLVRQTTWHQTAWILKHSLLHIDGDSGLVHLSHALLVRSVVLFGPTDGGYYGYDSNRNVGPAECGNCWWSTPDWLATCPRGLTQPACMASISPAAVMLEVGSLMTAGTAVSATLVTRALYDTATLKAGASTLTEIFLHAGLVPVPISRHATDPVSGIYLHASKQWEYLFALGAIEMQGGAQDALRIADVGGGRGALAPYLAASGHEVTIFDLNFLWDHGGDPDIERRYMTEASSRGWQARFGSVYSLPVDDGAFDVALCISVVEHAPYKDLMLRELLRIVRPGGLVILTFDFAAEPEVFHDALRVDIFGPHTLDAALAGIGAVGAGFSLAEFNASTAAITRDAVLGIPAGMTVGGVVLCRMPC